MQLIAFGVDHLRDFVLRRPEDRLSYLPVLVDLITSIMYLFCPLHAVPVLARVSTPDNPLTNAYEQCHVLSNTSQHLELQY
jgi:hypothetical protein